MEGIATPYDWGEPIEVPRKVPRLVRVPSDRTIRGVLVSDRLWKLVVHFNGKRCRPCTLASSGNCDLCATRPARLYFLVCVHQYIEDTQQWVQVTPDAMRPIQSEFADFSTLLGCEVEIGRIRKTMAAPIYFKVEKYTTKRKVKKPADPTETLTRVFFGERPRDNGS